MGTHHVPPTVEGSWVKEAATWGPVNVHPIKEGLCGDLLLPTHEGCCRGLQGWDPSRDTQG